MPFTISRPQQNIIAISINDFVPVQEISAPACTGRVTLVISVAACLLKTGEPSGNETHTIDIPYNDTIVAAQVLEFHVGTRPRSLVVTAARLIYKRLEYDTWCR